MVPTVVRFGAPRLALDLGSGATRIASSDNDLVAEIRSAVSGPLATRGALAVAPGVSRPIEHGVVVDVDAAVQMLAPLLWASRRHAPWQPRVLVCHPSDASRVELDRIEEAVVGAGAGSVCLVPEPLAAGLAGLDGERARPRLVIDLGEGVTDIAVVLQDRLLATSTIRRGLGEMRDELIREVEREHEVALRSTEAAALLATEEGIHGWVPVSRALGRRRRARQDGRRLVSHLVLVKGEVIARAVNATLEAVTRCTAGLLDTVGSKDAKQIETEGIVLTGGGALVPQLRSGIGRRLGLSVRPADEPLHAVIKGAQRLLRGEAGGLGLPAFCMNG